MGFLDFSKFLHLTGPGNFARLCVCARARPPSYLSQNQMLKYKNFGRKSLTELVEKLDSMNLQFGMQVDKIMTEEV